jgi:hypothetical protein
MGQRPIVELFISSSADCDLERECLLQEVQNYNETARKMTDLEVHAFGPDNLYSGIGSHGQEVVNRQLRNYDIYVGIWRERTGTSTPVAPSGTMEELREAVQRHARTRRPWVMPYFWKRSPTDFSAIKDELVAHGCFYHSYDDPQHLGEMFFEHLSGYLRDEYRLPGHSTTRMDSANRNSRINDVHFTFQIFSADGQERKQSVNRSVVAIGRKPDRNEIVFSSDLVHREQGMFVWKDGLVFYVDIARDSQIQYASHEPRENVQYGLTSIEVGDAVLLPDGSRVVLRAVVD